MFGKHGSGKMEQEVPGEGSRGWQFMQSQVRTDPRKRSCQARYGKYGIPQQCWPGKVNDGRRHLGGDLPMGHMQHGWICGTGEQPRSPEDMGCSAQLQGIPCSAPSCCSPLGVILPQPWGAQLHPHRWTRRLTATRGGHRAHGDKQQPQHGCLPAASAKGFGSQNLVLANRAIAADSVALLCPAGTWRHEAIARPFLPLTAPACVRGSVGNTANTPHCCHLLKAQQTSFQAPACAHRSRPQPPSICTARGQGWRLSRIPQP